MIIGAFLLLAVSTLGVFIFLYSRSKSRLNRQLEAQKEQLEKQKSTLINLNSIKDRLFSVISHDLRGPIGSFIELIRIAKKTDNNGLNINEVLGIIQQSAEQLSKLLDGLLDWALKQDSGFSYEPANISVNEILQDATEVYKEVANTKGIELIVDATLDLSVFVDKNSTITIIRNLINNAVKFTNSGGQIEVKAEKDLHNERVIFSVADTGIGIPEKKLKNLDNLKIGSATKGTGGETGLGLGLQLVHEFTKLNKGEVEVESKVGVGTTFKISLPEKGAIAA